MDLGIETFIAGLDSPAHSPESRRAWIALFYRDLKAVAEVAAALKAAAEATATMAARYCSCRADTELAAGPTCTACGHRDHGHLGCGAVIW
jgi:hypothetical protein